MSAFACGRCDECDGGRGYEYCLKPRGDPTFRCACGRVGVVMECDRCAPHPDPELVERLTRERDQALARVRRITTDVLTGLSAAGIATPELGYEVESWAISGDIDRLAKERDEGKARAEKAEAERNEARTLAKTAGEALLAAGLMVLPERCSPRCSSNAAQYDEDNRCDCGREEGEHRNKVCVEGRGGASVTPNLKLTPAEARFVRDLTALLDAERASAREEQREADVLAIYGPAVADVAARVKELESFGAKVNAIRNSIVGARALNWSEHAYPLVAALDAAGFVGLPYPEARKNVGTLVERLELAERERDEARAEAVRLADMHRRCEAYDDQPGPSCVVWKARAEKAEEALAVQVREWRARVDQAVAALSEIIARQKSALAQARWPDVEEDHLAADKALLACIDDDEVRDQFDAVERWYA